MDPERWQQVKSILDASLEKSAEELPAWLDAVCVGDDQLHGQVARLLSFEDRLDAFSGAAPGRLLRPGDGSSIVGQQIGPYRVRQLLGRGGMGAVYRAERTQGFRQTVALKLMRPGIENPLAWERFHREREILAGLEHPNISRLLDGATADDGRPYFAMELVDGGPIDRYCDEHRLDIRQRLKLLLPVCDALSYAHRKLVIHRDLKPANILVDQQRRPKLLDFGIARLIGPESATQFTSQMMTPRFASPEQLLDQPVSTATDVYSLGVVLYQLLTGRLPCGLDTCSSTQVPHAVCEEQPVAPSKAVRQPADLTSTASGRLPGQRRETVLEDDAPRGPTPEDVAIARSSDPGSLERALRGDLDAIVLKALRKEPEHRYTSVDRFAEDLRRYLTGYPVAARRGTLTYRAARFIRRNRVQMAMTAAMVAMLLAFGGAQFLNNERLEAERDRAEIAGERAARQAVRARQEALAASQVSTFLVDMFKSADPRRAGKGADALTAREVLESGTKRLRDGLTGQPEVRARLLTTIGDVYVSLGLFSEAEPLLRESLALREEIFGPDSLEVADSVHQLGRLTAFARGPVEQLEPLFRRALAIREQHLDADDLRLAESLRSLGVVHNMMSRYDQARDLLSRALAIREQKLGPEHADVADVLQRLAHTEAGQARFDVAIPLMERAIAISKRHLGPEHPKLVPILGNYVRFYLDGGRPEEAASLAEGLLELSEKHFGTDHQYTAESLQTLARVHIASGRFEQARPLLDQALAVYRSKGGDYRVRVAALRLQARVSLELGALDSAEELLTRAQTISKRGGVEIVSVIRAWAMLRQAQGDYEQAASLQQRALTLIEERKGSRHRTAASILEDYAVTLRSMGRDAEAAQAEAQAQSIRSGE